jgi:hypothetical protein
LGEVPLGFVFGLALETSPPNPLSIDGDGESRLLGYSLWSESVPSSA